MQFKKTKPKRRLYRLPYLKKKKTTKNLPTYIKSHNYSDKVNNITNY